MPKPSIAFKEIASRITGISIPVFGVSWNPPEAERKIVRETFIFLEDRRALYNDFAHELVFSAFIDDPNEIVLCRSRIWKNWIDLSKNQIHFEIRIIDT